jgi:hypothetical protein
VYEERLHTTHYHCYKISNLAKYSRDVSELSEHMIHIGVENKVIFLGLGSVDI